MTSSSWSSIKSFTKAKIFSRPLRAKRRLFGLSPNISLIRAECRAIVVVHRYGSVMFVVQIILWCGMGVMYGVYLVKNGVYLSKPRKMPRIIG